MGVHFKGCTYLPNIEFYGLGTGVQKYFFNVEEEVFYRLWPLKEISKRLDCVILLNKILGLISFYKSTG